MTIPQTADNKPEEDARHFYIWNSLHCVRPCARCFATVIAGDRNDFFRQDVICHWRRMFFDARLGMTNAA